MLMHPCGVRSPRTIHLHPILSLVPMAPHGRFAAFALYGHLPAVNLVRYRASKLTAEGIRPCAKAEAKRASQKVETNAPIA